MSTVLCVSDIVKLAAAGVQITLTEVVPQQDPQTEPQQRWHRTLMDSFWDRWRRLHVRAEGAHPNFEFFAHEHGDKVTAVFCPPNTAPILIEDDRCIYPSDALMAKIELWGKTK